MVCGHRQSDSADYQASALDEPSESIMYRQGDILLIPLEPELQEFDADSAERIPRERGRVVLAHGEATGHAHTISSLGATLYQQFDERFLRLRWSSWLRHQEQASIRVPRGTYRVVRQVEYPDVVVID